MLALGALGLRAAYLGLIDGSALSARAADQNTFPIDIEGTRGSIVSADDHDLAIDEPAVEVTASPRVIKDPRAAAAQLAPILGLDRAALERELSGDAGYAMLARAVSPGAGERAERLDLDGIYFRDSYKRFLPGRQLAQQLIGLTNFKRAGGTGLEAALDEYLAGKPGRRVEVRDLFGRTIKVLSDTEPTPGRDVKLTIDATLQERVEQVIADARKQFGAKSAMAMVMDPRTGAVLSMATVPSFDPNDRRRVDQSLTRNRPIEDTFEPGSTFKLVTMTAALEDGKVTPDTALWVPERVRLFDRYLSDSHPRPAQEMTVTQILERSSNVGTYLVARRVGKHRLQAWIERFGFGHPTGIAAPGEVDGLVLPASEWSGTSILNIPIGQGIGVTLAQMATAYASIANGGVKVEPRLIDSIGGEAVDHPAGRRIMSAGTAGQINEMLRGVVSEDGTGSAAAIKGYEVAGKTGTANKFDAELGEYSHTRYTASFMGYVPADNPRFVIAVAVDEPSAGSIYGGDVAAPAFEKIAQFALQKYNVAP